MVDRKPVWPRWRRARTRDVDSIQQGLERGEALQLEKYAAVAAIVAVPIAIASIALSQCQGSSSGSSAGTTASSSTTRTTQTTAPVTNTSVVDGDSSGSSPIASTFLASVDPLTSNSWFADDTNIGIDGKVYAHAVTSGVVGNECISDYSKDVQTIEYSIDRRYTHLRGLVGETDRSMSGKPVRVTIAGDGRTLWENTVQVGQPASVDLGVSGILRLTVVATRLWTGFGCAYASFADPTLS